MIEDIESRGPDILCANVEGDSIPALVLAALDQARRLYGPRDVAELAVEGMSCIASSIDPRGGEFRTTVIVRCVNFAALNPPGGTFIPDVLPEDPADACWAEDPSEIGLPGSGGEDK